MAPNLSPAAQSLLVWLREHSGEATVWVDVDLRKQTRGKTIRALTDAGLAEFRKGDDGTRFMRISALGRAVS